ncbi:hypothetical protein HPP92_025327 [Vanilla planifolia]|uniref:SET domain-containing protein n=1 Tax=Vanilla planifolia TaxID=51239 RepID=A0A835PMH4_VANPL|nr:hypothetical protein HPP92_025327 [Vanilla planifolia]
MSKEAEEMKMQALLHWAADVGISDAPLLDSDSSSCSLGRSLAVSYFPHAGGRGLAAVSNLRIGDLVLRVPRAALNRESVLQDEKIAFCIKKHPHLSSSQILTICLLAEVDKGKGSWWYPYLVLLPMNYNTLANFNEFEIRALQVDDAIWVSEKAVLKARSDWKECLIVLQEMKLKPKLLSLRSWIWASATVSSRTLHIPWDDAGCLCPVGDLFNYAAPDEPCMEDEQQHTEQPDLRAYRLTDGGYEEDSASYCFYANKNYQKGEQVLLGYGTYSNLDLLEHYGFFLLSNPNDKAFLPLHMNINTSKSRPMKDAVYIQPDGKPSFALLCALRLWATPFNNRRAVGHLAYAGSFLSNENELLVMRKLAKHCSKVLEELPTTVENDASLLVIINKMLESGSHLGCLQLAFCRDEVVGFMQANGLKMESSAESLPTAKFMRSLERWRLSVNWRFSLIRTSS